MKRVASATRRFAKDGYRVTMLARDDARLRALEEELRDLIGIACDVTDLEALQGAISSLGTPKVVVHNAVGGRSARS